MKHFTLILSFFLITMGVFAQYSNGQGNDPIYKDKFYEAEEYIEEAKFEEAIAIYKELLKTNPNDDAVNFRLGYCYLFTTERWNAIEPLEKVTKNYEKSGEKAKFAPLDAYYALGYAYYVNYIFDDAKNTYEKLLSLTKNKEDKKAIEEKIKICENAINLFNDPKMMMVIKLGVINSEYSDHSPTVTADESMVIFTSRREGSTGEKISEDGKYYEDLYVYDKKLGLDAKPYRLDTTVNTTDHEATCGLSFDGSELFMYKATKKDRGDIFTSVSDGEKWSAPKKVEGEVNTKKRESHASISTDGKKLYFTSDRKGGYGGMDIYVADRDSTTGEWINVKNLGPKINTKLDEEGPFINYDDNTLYFSSQGHNTMGGFDIYKSKLNEEGNWSEVENMGFPLNTVDDDVFFVPTIRGNRAYYSSQQEGGESNIYIVELYENENDMILVTGFTYDSNIKSNNYNKKDVSFKGDTVVIGTRKIAKRKIFNYNYNDSILITDMLIDNDKISVTDSLCKIPEGTIIADYYVKTKTIDNLYNPNEKTGKYMFVIRPGERHLIYYEAEGHMFDIKHIEELSPGYHDIFHKAEMDTLIRGEIKQSRTTDFDLETNELSEHQKLELDLLSNFMKKNDFLYVDLSAQAYTEPATEMGDARINTAQNYLIASGISEDRIVTNLSENQINPNSLEYTLYDETTLEKAKDKIPVVTETKEVFVVFVSNILFEINKHKTTKYDQELNTLAEYIKENADASVKLIGYTDTQGPVNYNKQLSKKRAAFVESYLIDKGVDKTQIESEGKGFEKQIAKNRDQNGKYIWDALGYNRRVEIIVTKQGQDKQLKVKQVEVPEKYIIEDKTGGATYSININESATKQNIADFETGTKEFKKDDNTYYYYIGSFTKLNEAQNELYRLKVKYPNAFIFQNN